MAETGYLHVEAGIVDQHHGIGLPGQDVLLAQAQVFCDAGGFCDNVRDSHDRAVPIMDHGRNPACSGHQVTAPEAEFRLRVAGPEPFEKIAAVQVAGSLARYQIKAHRRFISSVSVL